MVSVWVCVHQTGGASYQAHRWWHIWVAGQRCVRSASSQARLGTVCVEFHMLAPWLHKPAPDQRLWTFHRHSPIPAHRLPPSFIYIFLCRSHLCFSRFLSVLSRDGAIDRFLTINGGLKCHSFLIVKAELQREFLFWHGELFFHEQQKIKQIYTKTNLVKQSLCCWDLSSHYPRCFQQCSN